MEVLKSLQMRNWQRHPHPSSLISKQEASQLRAMANLLSDHLNVSYNTQSPYFMAQIITTCFCRNSTSCIFTLDCNYHCSPLLLSMSALVPAHFSVVLVLDLVYKVYKLLTIPTSYKVNHNITHFYLKLKITANNSFSLGKTTVKHCKFYLN